MDHCDLCDKIIWSTQDYVSETFYCRQSQGPEVMTYHLACAAKDTRRLD